MQKKLSITTFCISLCLIGCQSPEPKITSPTPEITPSPQVSQISMESKEFENDSKTNEYYNLSENNPFGAIVADIDLATIKLSQPLIESLRADIHKHQLLIFKNQAPSNNHIVPPSKRVKLQKYL